MWIELVQLPRLLTAHLTRLCRLCVWHAGTSGSHGTPTTPSRRRRTRSAASAAGTARSASGAGFSTFGTFRGPIPMPESLPWCDCRLPRGCACSHAWYIGTLSHRLRGCTLPLWGRRDPSEEGDMTPVCTRRSAVSVDCVSGGEDALDTPPPFLRAHCCAPLYALPCVVFTHFCGVDCSRSRRHRASTAPSQRPVRHRELHAASASCRLRRRRVSEQLASPRPWLLPMQLLSRPCLSRALSQYTVFSSWCMCLYV